MTPDPTPAELDEWERTYAEFPVVPRLIKALHARRQDFKTLAGQADKLMDLVAKLEQQSKAKDAVVEALGGVTPQETMHAIAWITGVQSSYAREGVTEQAAQLLSTAAKCLRVLYKALAALDKKPDD